jgi:hypothetical protein
MLIKCIIYTIIYIGLLMSTFIKQIRYNFKCGHGGVHLEQSQCTERIIYSYQNHIEITWNTISVYKETFKYSERATFMLTL